MMQTSISAWLKKSVIAEEESERGTIATNVEQQPHSTLPTPPPEEVGGPDSLLQECMQRPSTSEPAPSISFGTSGRPLHPKIALEALTKQTLQGFKRLNSLLLPIPYKPAFYEEIFSDPVTSSITLVATWHDTPHIASKTNAKNEGQVVGGIRCRILSSSSLQLPASAFSQTRSTSTQSSRSSEEEKVLYVSTLGILAPYRHLGIANHLFTRVLALAIQQHGVRAVGAHVWEANEEGREWYRNMGFKEVRTEAGYYRRLTPQGAVVVRRSVGVGDLLGK